MFSFILCVVLIIGSYFTYSKLVENTFGPDDRETPAVAINDGVDYVVLPAWRMFMIQLLNIAGLGPILGVLTGAIWGPIVYLWITFGTIFAGCTHDYFSGMLSERNNGASISEVVGIYLGPIMKNVMRVFSVVLLIMVGTVFAVNPANIIVKLTTESGAAEGSILREPVFWLTLIVIYYFISTFVSIDKIIGKIYPVFGICLIIMAVGVGIGTVAKIGSNNLEVPELWSHFYNMHPNGNPVWSLMFITVACGAISGFHATQSPLMARCLKSERQGRFVFSGAMTAEGVIAMVWALAGCAWYEHAGGLSTGLLAAGGGNAGTVYDICQNTMGGVGTILAMLGVIACPITSGDTAFRSARLTIADWFKIDQGDLKKRLGLTVPVLGVGALLGFGSMFKWLDYSSLWNYFSWSNQTLAMIVLWAGAMYLAKEKKNFWVCAVPATFMSAVSMTYFCISEKECLGPLLNTYEIITKDDGTTAKKIVEWATHIGYPVGIICAAAFFGLFWWASGKYRKAAEATA